MSVIQLPYALMPQAQSPPLLRNILITTATCLLAALTGWLLSPRIGPLQARAAAIFVLAAILWATEALPLFATSLCVVGLEILLLAKKGGLSGVGNLSYDQFLAPFSSSIIILFMGGFLLAAAITKHSVDRAVAARFLLPLARQPTLLIFGILAVSGFFSMWMSNTAATAMVLAIIAPIVKELPAESRFVRAVVLAAPFGANIGGIGTPIGTPPNAVALAALRQAGYHVSFIQWMLLAVPLMMVLLTVVGVLLAFFFKPDLSTQALLRQTTLETKPIDAKGKFTIAILLCTIGLWLSESSHGIDSAVVALIAAAVLTAFRVLDRRDIDSIDWDVLLLMWGGLTLGHALELSGLLGLVKQLPLEGMQGWALSGAFVLLAIGLSTFMSNTAAANLVIPLAMSCPHQHRVPLVILAGLACSFAMAMPISTPPNAMAFATGKVPVSAMLLVGGLLGIFAVVALVLGYQWVLPMVVDLTT